VLVRTIQDSITAVHAHTHAPAHTRARHHARRHSHAHAQVIIPAYLLITMLTFFGTILFAVEYDPLCSVSDAGNGSQGLQRPILSAREGCNGRPNPQGVGCECRISRRHGG
jgi:hypothetical protein